MIGLPYPFRPGNRFDGITYRLAPPPTSPAQNGFQEGKDLPFSVGALELMSSI